AAFLLVGGLVLGAWDSIARAAEQPADHARRLATEAAGLVAKHGLADACRAMEAPGSRFNQGDTYAFIMDLQGVWRCFPPKPKAEGQSAMDIRDPDGKAMLPEQIAIVRSPAGQGWVDYRWNNPATGKIQPKRSFVIGIPGTDFFAVSGYYK
ncbi:MAG: cache domain-containing protein, partial [Acetobacteraceae bacterium]